MPWIAKRATEDGSTSAFQSPPFCTNVSVRIAPITKNLSGINADPGRVLQIIQKMIEKKNGVCSPACVVFVRV